MSIIVAGKLILKPQSRDEFIEKSLEAIVLARKNGACEDFSVSPDPVELNRVNIFEKWENRRALKEFRESSQESDYFSLIESFDVNEYEINT